MKVSGRCFCGKVTCKAVIDPETVAICHGTDCQSHPGTAFGVVAGDVDGPFDILTGSLKSITTLADSGATRELTFCPECGTRRYANSPAGKADFFGFRFGTIDQKNQLKPKFRVYCRPAQKWAIIDSIPRFETHPAQAT